MSVEKRDWQQLCDEISREHDPDRLMMLISELLEALDERKALAKRGSLAKPSSRES
jgi:hypothetical protein